MLTKDYEKVMKQRGAYSENRFRDWALSRGYSVVMVGGQSVMDAVIAYASDTGIEMMRVQVKSASQQCHGAKPLCKEKGCKHSTFKSSLRLGKLPNGEPARNYTPEDFDVLFFYGNDDNMWFIPVNSFKALSCRSVWLNGQYDQFRVYFDGDLNEKAG